jgi:hypothetical protein
MRGLSGNRYDWSNEAFKYWFAVIYATVWAAASSAVRLVVVLWISYKCRFAGAVVHINIRTHSIAYYLNT